MRSGGGQDSNPELGKHSDIVHRRTKWLTCKKILVDGLSNSTPVKYHPLTLTTASLNKGSMRDPQLSSPIISGLIYPKTDNIYLKI